MSLQTSHEVKGEKAECVQDRPCGSDKVTVLANPVVMLRKTESGDLFK